jgi:hypothetical protein
MATKAKKKPKASKAGANGTPPSAEGVLTLAEAAKLLRVSETGLQADAAAGRVPCRLVAGEWRFKKEAIFEWLSQPDTGVEARKNALLAVAGSLRDETPEEFEAYMANIRAHRDEIDRATGSGKYAPE